MTRSLGDGEGDGHEGHDAVVYLWARESELAGGLESRLHAAVKDWIRERWPFRSVGYPGRDRKYCSGRKSCRAAGSQPASASSASTTSGASFSRGPIPEAGR